MRQTPLQAVVRHALDDAPPWTDSEPGCLWPLPRDASPDLGHWVAGRVLSYYAAVHGVANELEASEGLTMLRVAPANERVLVLGAARTYRRLYVVPVYLVPPVARRAVVAAFEPTGVTWAVLGSQEVKRLLHQNLLVLDESTPRMGTLELVAFLRLLGEGQAPIAEE